MKAMFTILCFVPQKFGLLAWQTFEFGARDRFEGRNTALGFNVVF